MSITPITGFCVLAKVKVGSNGNVLGAPECVTGISTEVSNGRKTWDSNLADGLDSGWVPIALTLDAGGAKWDVSGASPARIDYAASWGEIFRVTLQAAVDGAGRKFSFRNVVIGFFTHSSDTVPDETIGLVSPDVPVADTMGLNNPIDAEQITEVSPDGSGYKKVQVTADVRLQSTGTSLPGSEAVFGGIFVYTDTCS
jgi:hypothetical protein